MPYLITYERAIQVLRKNHNITLSDTELRQIMKPDPDKRIFFVSVNEKYLRKELLDDRKEVPTAK